MLCSPDDIYYFHYLANKRPKLIEDPFKPIPNIHEKGAALAVLPSVVALVSCSGVKFVFLTFTILSCQDYGLKSFLFYFQGDKEVMEGSCTIIETNDVTSIVLTSANLIRRSSVGKFVQNNLIDDLKVCAFSSHY